MSLADLSESTVAVSLRWVKDDLVLDAGTGPMALARVWWSRHEGDPLRHWYANTLHGERRPIYNNAPDRATAVAAVEAWARGLRQ